MFHPGFQRRLTKTTQEHGENPRFEVIELPRPEPGPTDLLVKLSATGLCGTDLALAAGELGPTHRILGHEGIGRVVKIGAGLTDCPMQVGQRVGVAWIRDACGRCAMCLHDGGETRCVQQAHSGRKVDGTLAEYTVVPYRYVTEVPEDIPDELLAPIMCGGVTAYKALKICGATPGQWIAISGAGGGVGALAIQYARAMGYRVLAIDAGDAKREYCLSLQAEAYLDVTKEKDIAAAAMEVTEGQGASAVLVAAGSASAYQDAFGMLAPFGTLVCVGIPPPSQLVHFHPLQFIDKGIRVIGSVVGTRGDIREAIEFVRRKAVVPRVQTVTLDQITEIARLCASNKVCSTFCILT